MMIIAFSFLTLLNSDYKSAIIKFNSFDNHNWIHYDVMDGIFVENKTFDSRLIKEVLKVNNSFNDVHLMVGNIENNINQYLLKGIDQVTFHYEAIEKANIKKLIDKIHSFNIKVGMSIKPNTDVRVLDEYLKDLDFILVMSVEPGKGGQTFLESSLDKIRYLKRLKEKYHYLIGVDGGINASNIKQVESLGADVAIVGSYLSNDLTKEKYNSLK